ncbi:hypothetical protein [Allobaculum stercoricanis]|uniref:hypothetical protein n=1 Tax=Allobaculum stercoricanis TaxID=174709 RepID=UPI00037D6C5F|nr:hypothetical protein [Allobaculum stercoricanis]
MKEKNTAKTKRSLKSRFKKESREPKQTIEEKEIDREQLVELLKQTASQEDHLEDLLVITPQPKKTMADQVVQKKDLEQGKKDVSKLNSSPMDLDVDSIEEKQEKSQFGELEQRQSAQKELLQQSDSFAKQDHDPDLEKQNLLQERNINIEREDQQISSYSHGLNEADQMQCMDQENQQEKQDSNRKEHSSLQDQRTIQEKEREIDQLEKKELNTNQQEELDLRTRHHFELIQNQVSEIDQAEHVSFHHQNLNQIPKKKSKSLKKLEDEKDQLDTSLIEEAIEENSSAQDQFEKSQVQSKTQGKRHVHQHKISHLLHQWQTYFVFGAMFSIFFLLWKIHALHFFKLSFAGMILGLGMIVISMAIFGFYYVPKRIGNIGAVLLCVLVTTQSLGLQNELNLISNSIAQMSDIQQNSGRAMGIYVPAHIPISSLAALDGETIGIMAQRDDEGIHAVLTSLADQGIHVQTKSYSSLQQLSKGAKGLAVRAVILNEADVRFIDDFTPSASQTPSLTKVFSLTMPAQTKNAPTTTSKDLEVEPYTILISGSNDPLSQRAYRSNFNLLVTIHPQTKQVLTTFIPRTLAVASKCQEQNACPQGVSEERLSLVSYNSIEALKQSLEETLDIPIDFTVRIDFSKLIELFDLDPSLRYQQANEVDSYVDIQHGQGERYNIYQMKQLIGNVQDLAPDDMNQELTILRVLKTILQAQEMPHTKDLAPILELLQQAVSTSLNPNQLAQLIKTFLIFPMKMEAHYTWLQSQTTTQYSPTLTEMLYMAKADGNSLETIKQAIQAIVNASPNRPAQIQVDPLPQPSTLEAILQNQEQQVSSQAPATEQANQEGEPTPESTTPVLEEGSDPLDGIEQDLPVDQSTPLESDSALEQGQEVDSTPIEQ